MRLGYRILWTVIAFVAILSGAGAIYQSWSVRRESSRFPPPGRLVSIDASGRRLHLVCIGEGVPTVIFESSHASNALSFYAARQEVSAHTRVCSYDRMGAGWSDPGPDLIPVGALVADLEQLIAHADLRPPFILVPSSMGGIVAELFARRHPDQIAGLVFLDALNSVIHERFSAHLTAMQTRAICLTPLAARLGLYRALDPYRLRSQHSEDADRSISRLYRPEPLATLCGIARAVSATTDEFAAAPPLPPDIPLVSLVHDLPGGILPPGLSSLGLAGEVEALEREWLPLQQRFAEYSRQGVCRVVPGSTHLIAASQPHAVASTIIEISDEARK